MFITADGVRHVFPLLLPLPLLFWFDVCPGTYFPFALSYAYDTQAAEARMTTYGSAREGGGTVPLGNNDVQGEKTMC